MATQHHLPCRAGSSNIPSAQSRVPNLPKWCPSQREEYFAADQPPLPPEDDLWRQVQFDTWTGLLASAECTNDYIDDILAINVTDEWARHWILQDENGQQWARDMGFSEVFLCP